MELPPLILEDTFNQQKDQLIQATKNFNKSLKTKKFRQKRIKNLKCYIKELEKAINILLLYNNQNTALLKVDLSIKTDKEILQYIKKILQYIKNNNLNNGEKVVYCWLFDNGFEFKTEKYGYKLYNFNGNDLIGNKAKGEIVTWCRLFDNGFKFETEKYGLEEYDFNGNRK